MKIKVLRSVSGLYLCNNIGSTSTTNKYCLAYDYDLLTRWGDLIFNFAEDTEEEEQYNLDAIAREWNSKGYRVSVDIVEVDFNLTEV